MRHRLFLLIVPAAALAACGGPEPTAEPAPRVLAVTSDTTVGTGQAAELRQWLGRWQATRAGRDYTFTLRRGCFCVEEARRPVIIDVKGDAVVAVRDAATNASRPVDEFGGWPTIEGLFAQAIAQAEAGTPRPVTYAAAGFPVAMTIGAIEADAGATYELSAVTVGR